MLTMALIMDDAVKRLIRKGIPNRHRRKVWLHYSGAEQLMLANEGVYLSMLQREKDENAANGTENGPKKVNMAIDQIERDLHRTFPDNVHFQQMETVPPFTTSFPPPPYAYSTPLLHSLRRVLVAYSFYNPRLGYCQSLNYIVGLLLLFMPEEEAFWMLVSIIQNIMPDQMYSKNLRGTVTEMKVLTGVARTKCRDVLDKVKKGGMIELDALISPWFLTLFINILPIECVLRVWDCLYYEGNKILYRIALAVLKLNEDKIMKIKDPMEVVVHIQNCPKSMVNCHRLMDTAFKRFGSHAVGHLSEKEIQKKRANAAKDVAAKMGNDDPSDDASGSDEEE